MPEASLTLIESLSVGDELDTIIAQKVMGWTRRYGAQGDGWYIRRPSGKWNSCPEWDEGDEHWTPFKPSTDMSAAWLVLEKLPLKFWPEVRRMDNGDWTCDICLGGPTPSEVIDLGIVERADSAPLAICRAALRAVEMA